MDNPLGLAVIILLLTPFLLLAILVISNSFLSLGKARQGIKMPAFFVSIAKSEASPENLKSFLLSLSGLKAQGWNNIVHGRPYVALEFVSSQSSNMIHFYLGAPENQTEFVSNKLKKFFPSVKILSAPSYNILNPEGHHFAGSLKKTNNLTAVYGAFKSIEELNEGEAGALQILLRP